jgi:hypothetical protein
MTEQLMGALRNDAGVYPTWAPDPRRGRRCLHEGVDAPTWQL